MTASTDKYIIEHTIERTYKTNTEYKPSIRNHFFGASQK